MSQTVEFKAADTDPDLRRYGLAERQLLADDHYRHLQLARHLEISPKDLVFLAIEDAVRWREAARGVPGGAG